MHRIVSGDHYGQIFKGVVPLYGFHEPEEDIWGPFVWSKRKFLLRQEDPSGYYFLKMCYYGQSGRLSIRSNGKRLGPVELSRGWNGYLLDLSILDRGQIEFELNEPIPVTGDLRELGVMIREFRPIGNREEFAALEKAALNKMINDREFTEGRCHLSSFPQRLVVTTAGRCNIKPHCVYCDWTRAKDLEEASDFKLTVRGLREMGSFYECATHICDASHGEPSLEDHFGRFVEEFHKEGRIFEWGTNGQLLGKEKREMILGRRMVVYVSADSCTAAGYARYRNGKFDIVVDNLRHLCREKKARGNRPTVLMSFVAMRSNRGEFGCFLDLVKDIGADGVKLMNLDLEDHLQDRITHRSGFRFHYEQEALRGDELARLVEGAKKLAAEKKVPLINRMNFGSEERILGGPLCSDPWKTIHPLNRGLVLCSFSKSYLLARWSDRGHRRLSEFLGDVWNGPLYRSIRSALKEHRLPEICRKSPSCPVVKRKAGHWPAICAEGG